jgi:hypothetical protein
MFISGVYAAGGEFALFKSTDSEFSEDDAGSDSDEDFEYCFNTCCSRSLKSDR